VGWSTDEHLRKFFKLGIGRRDLIFEPLTPFAPALMLARLPIPPLPRCETVIGTRITPRDFHSRLVRQRSDDSPFRPMSGSLPDRLPEGRNTMPLGQRCGTEVGGRAREFCPNCGEAQGGSGATWCNPAQSAIGPL